MSIYKYFDCKVTLVLFLVLLLPYFYTTSANRKTDYLDLFIGTAGDYGQVDPGACVPYSMVRISPDCVPRSHSGYDFEVTEINGFSINRLSGIGCSGAGGNLRINPASKGSVLNMDKKSESAIAGYYTVVLDNGVKSEFTATHNVAFERFYYPVNKKNVLTIDFSSSFTEVKDFSFEIISENEITGFIQAQNACRKGAYKIYFNLTTNKAFDVLSKSKQELELLFTTNKELPVEIRIAISAIDKETAREENQKVAQYNFEEIKNQAELTWENLLSKISIEATPEQKKLFYTSLYRVFLSPANTSSWDGKYLGTDGEIYKNDKFNYYSSWSIWDTYRTKFPLITLLDPMRMQDIVNSLCKLYENGKSNWSTDYESTPSVRTEHAATVILDAYSKGITDIRLESAYSGIKAEVNRLPMKRPDQVLESCIDIWTIAQIAKKLEKHEDAKSYANQAKKLFTEIWIKEFMNIDSSFVKMKDNGLYQGTRWQYRWALPQFLNIMTESVGGKVKLTEELDFFFANHLNNQGNEVGIHAPYIFNRLGQPNKTQQIVNRIFFEDTPHYYGGNAEHLTPYIGRPFKVDPKGFLPEMDEDDGTMSAWYVFSTIGIFPLIVGEPWYEISSPAFNKVAIQLDGGRALVINTINRNNHSDFIKEIRFNNEIISDFRINHNDLIHGGVLELEY